tara:strand:+ start:7795 stop:8067 length:273 start_codon:yes stop_codon:yes gene_type:complete
MNEPNTEELNSKIFNLIKKSKEIEHNDLLVQIGLDTYYTNRSLDILKTEYNLISIYGSKLTLSEKGLKYKSFASYLKSLKHNPNSTHQNL